MIVNIHGVFKALLKIDSIVLVVVVVEVVVVVLVVAALRDVFPRQRRTEVVTVERLRKHGTASSNLSQTYGVEFDAKVSAASLVFKIMSFGYAT